MNESKKVRCVDCGMFSAWRPGEGILVCITQFDRVTAKESGLSDEGMKLFGCAAKEIKLEGATGTEKFIAIETPRNCESFIEFFPALITPKEHLEMKLLKEQREWQASESKAARDWQGRQNLYMIAATVIGGLLSFLGGVACAIVTVMLTRPAQ